MVSKLCLLSADFSNTHMLKITVRCTRTYIHTYIFTYMNYGVPYCLYDRYGEYIILEFICDVTKIQLNVTYNLIKTILQLLCLSCFQPSIYSWILTINLGRNRFRAPCFTEPTPQKTVSVVLGMVSIWTHSYHRFIICNHF